jgi:hypothetical protein
MWRVASVVAWGFFALVLTGCDSVLERQYYKEGIGTELTTQSVPSAADLQDVYLTELCRQAGMVQVSSANTDPVLACPNWGLVTLAGLNDIDQRCDAYLAWLDDKRRSREPILSEISAIAGATAAILRTTGVGVNPITLVGIAFGLASNTFTNIRSRLLLEADHSTVQSIVLSRQQDFRGRLKPQSINSRADAIYVMRSYLRICMPMTIEMNINTTVTVFENAGAAALNTKGSLTAPRQSSGGASTQGVSQQRADKPIVVTPGPNKPAAGTEGRIEKPTFGFERAKALQRTLCVADNGDMSTPATRAALIDLKAALYFPRKTPAIKSGIVEDEDQDAEIGKAVAAVPSCMDIKLAGPFEVGLVARFGEMTIRSRLRRALEKAGVVAPLELVNPGNLSFGESIRPAVTTLRTQYNAKFHIPAGNSIDEPVWAQITKDNVVQ